MILDRFWDFLVDTLRIIFVPCICSYYTFIQDPFIHLANDHAQGLEKFSNTLFIPTHYVFDCRKAQKDENGNWHFSQKFNYSHLFVVKQTAAIIALPLSLVLGSTFKALSLLDSETKKNYKSMQNAWYSQDVTPNFALYERLGINLEMPKSKFTHQGYLRRPGDEMNLKHEKKALKTITDILNAKNIPWWVDCGTCLGALRYGGVIPWDEDIDIAILNQDFENLRKSLNALDPKDYLVQDWSTREHPQSFIKVYVRKSGTYIDLYSFKVHEEKKELEYILALETSIFFPKWWKEREKVFKRPISFSDLFPLKEGDFDGIHVNIPQNPFKYLQRYYGENLEPVKIFDPETGCYEKDLKHPYWQTPNVY